MNRNEALDRANILAKDYPDDANHSIETCVDMYLKYNCEYLGIDFDQFYYGFIRVEFEHIKNPHCNILNLVQQTKDGVSINDFVAYITMAHIMDVPNYYLPYLDNMRHETGETEAE